MKTIKIGKYNWYLVREMAGKTLLFPTENIVDGYFSDSSNNYSDSKANAFLTTVFFKSLESPDFDTKKIVNGIWLLTSIQYENYIKPTGLSISAPFLLRTPGEAEDLVQSVDVNGDVKSVNIKEKLGIRPGFMLDTEYVNELLGKEKKNTDNTPAEKPIVSEANKDVKIQKEDTIKTEVVSVEEKEQINTEASNSQPIKERIKPPVFNQQKNNPQNNASQQQSQNKNNQNASKNKKNKKKKTKNKKIETVQPISKPDMSSLYNVNNDELDILAAVDFEEKQEETVIEVKNSFTVDVIEEKREEPEDKKNISETSSPIKTEDKDLLNETKKEVQPVAERIVLDEQLIEDVSVIEKTQPLEGEVESPKVPVVEVDDVEIVEIESLPEIIPEKPIKQEKPVKPQSFSPFTKKPQKNKESTFKKFNKTNNETFASTTQQNAKKGQNAIMNKLGATDTPAESEMSTAIAAYTNGGANTVITKQSQPSSYSQNMSEINQFTIEQLRDILIKRNKQITKLKLSLIEVTAEHEAMLENIAKTKTEIENYKTEVEALTNQIEQLQKTIKKNEQSASDEKEDISVQHQKNIDKITARLNETTNNLVEAKNNLHIISEKNKKSETRAAELQNLLDEKEKEVQSYKTLLEEQSTKQKSNEQLNEMNEKMIELTTEKERILSENNSLAEQLRVANETIDVLKKELDEKFAIAESGVVDSQEVQKLTNEITTMKADMVKALRIAKKLKEDLDAETEKATHQAVTIKELTEKLNEMHSENSGLQGDIKNLKSAIEDSHKKISSAEEKLKLASEKEEELQSVIGNNTLTMHDMASEISNLRKQNKALSEEVSKSDTLTKTLLLSEKEKEEKIKELTEKVRESEKNSEAVSEYEKIIAELNNKLAEKDDIIEEKNKTIKELSDNIDSSYNDLSDFKKLIFEE